MIERWQVLLAAGLSGVASLALVPLETVVARPMAPWLLRGLASLQPAVLVALAVAVGEATATRVGLRAPLVDAWLAGDGAGAVFGRQIGPAVAVGLGVAGVLVAYGRLVAPRLAHGDGPRARLARLKVPLVTRLAYGGIAEEVMTRWGLLSLFVWLGWRLAGRGGEPATYILAAATGLAALLFALGHLPMLFVVAPGAQRWIVAAVVAGNLVPGVLFGWLFVRLGLEAAIFAHLSAHLLAALAGRRAPAS